MRQRLEEGLSKINEGLRILSGGPLDFYLNRADEIVRAMFDRFAPFRIGDRVELSVTPYIAPESGWCPSRHFLKAGATGVVRNVEFNDGLFVADVDFDEQTYLDSDGYPRPKEHGLYSFSEKCLRLITTKVDRP